MWSGVRHPALKPICSLRISSFLRIYFSSLAFKILLKLLRAKIGGKFLALLKYKSELLLTLIALAMPFLQMLVFFKVITLVQIYLISISMG
jgi:hypothetical protein